MVTRDTLLGSGLRAAMDLSPGTNGLSTCPSPPAKRIRCLAVSHDDRLLQDLESGSGDLISSFTRTGSLDVHRSSLLASEFELVFLDLRDALGRNDPPGHPSFPMSPRTAWVAVGPATLEDWAEESPAAGAWDFLQTPFSPSELRHVTRRVLRERTLKLRLEELEIRLGESTSEFDGAFGSPRMQALMDQARTAAAGGHPLLIRGERGTGKSTLALMIQRSSSSGAKAPVRIRCAREPEEILRGQILGGKAGSVLEQARGGTLFLEEVGLLSVPLQDEILKFVHADRPGAPGPPGIAAARTGVHLIATTTRDLEAEVKSGAFREDLLFYLNVSEVTIPPLRQRTVEILPLARQFIAGFSRSLGIPTPELSKPAEDALLAYSWPGNVMELRNSCERAVLLWPSRLLEPGAFPHRITEADPGRPRVGGEYSLDALEREHIECIIHRVPHLREAARILDIDNATLYRKRKRLGL